MPRRAALCFYFGEKFRLKTLRSEFQATINEYETAAEELKAANEEILSINEELQSTNEELETSKEEIQSVNEELNTVNKSSIPRLISSARSTTTGELCQFLGGRDDISRPGGQDQAFYAGGRECV